MFVVDLFFAGFVALLVTFALIVLFGWRHPRRPAPGRGGIFLFILLLAIIWAGGVWSQPYGPALWGGYWLPFVVIGLFAAMIILALGVGLPEADRIEPPAEPTDPEAAASVAIFGLFFWVLLIAALVAIVIAYLVN